MTAMLHQCVPLFPLSSSSCPAYVLHWFALLTSSHPEVWLGLSFLLLGSIFCCNIFCLLPFVLYYIGFFFANIQSSSSLAFMHFLLTRQYFCLPLLALYYIGLPWWHPAIWLWRCFSWLCLCCRHGDKLDCGQDGIKEGIQESRVNP
jgi:hypothetical protein